MSRRGKDILNQTTGLIKEAGGQIISVSNSGSGHQKIVFTYAGRTGKYFVSTSPSEYRGAKNNLCALKHKLKNMGGRNDVG